MPIRRKRETSEQRRYTRGSMKKRIVLRRPAHLGLLLAILIGALAVIAAALLWGSYLKEKSDAYRDSLQNGEWTVDEETATPYPVDVPSLRARGMWPLDSIGSTLVDSQYGGVILPLNQPSGEVYYSTAVDEAAGKEPLLIGADLASDVAKLKNRGFYVICTYTVTCFEATDVSMRAYLRGLDLARLSAYARAGADDLLLMGLPSGDSAKDAEAVDFLRELNRLLTDTGTRPAIGVALPLSAFSSDETSAADEAEEGTTPLYAGNLTPGRMLTACDYLAMDLTAESVQTLETILPRIQYAYVRYSLRLMLDREDEEVTEEALAHGFDRLLEVHLPQSDAPAS